MSPRRSLLVLTLGFVSLGSARAQDARPTKTEHDITVEMRFVWISEAAAEALGERLPPQLAERDAKPSSSMTAAMDDKQVAELMQVLQGDRRTSVMQTPRITLRSGQQATLQVGEEHFFLTGIDLKPGEEFTIHPKQAPIFIGHRHVLRPTLEEDGVTVRLDVQARITELAAPVPLVPIQVPVPQYHDQRPSKKGEPEVMQLFLQQPTVLKLSLESTLKIPDQKTQLVYVGRKAKEVRMESNVPLLSRVPYVSRLFRNVSYGSETQLLVVFLTPRVSAGAGGLATD